MDVKTFDDIEQQLKAPFYADQLEWKVQARTKDKKKGMVVPYIKGRALMDRLDEVLGIGNWWDYYLTVDGGVECQITIQATGDREVTKADAAEYVNITEWVDQKRVATRSLKGTYTNAFKRACSKFGIGRYLYDIPSKWVELDQKGKFKSPAIPKEFLPGDADKRGQKPGTPDVVRDEKEPEPTTESAEKKETKKKADKPAQVKVGASGTREKFTNIDATMLDHANRHNVPEDQGVPLAGKTFEQILKDEELGPAIIAYLAGAGPNKSGEFFDPEGDENLQKTQKAAQILYDSVVAA